MTPPTAPPADGWRSWTLGVRVVVRRRLDADDTHVWTDILGIVTALDDTGLSIETRHGPVRVEAAEIELGKVIPPPPVRRARRDPAE